MDESTVRPPRRRWRAVIALLVVTVIWGGTFTWMKEGLEAAEAQLGSGHESLGITTFLGLRFAAAALLLALLPACRRGLDGAAWKGGFWLAVLLYLGFALQMSGLDEVSPAVSAFLTSLYVLFTALISAFLARRGLSPLVVVGVLCATVGAGIIRGRPELAFLPGELFTICCALAFALHILATDRLTRRLPPMALTLASFVWVAGFALVHWCALTPWSAAGGPPAMEGLARLLVDPDFLLPLGLTTVLATVIALSLMSLFQRELDPVRAAILYAFEPIWAAIYGIARGFDELSSWLWIGGTILLAGNLLAELAPRREPEGARSSSPAG